MSTARTPWRLLSWLMLMVLGIGLALSVPAEDDSGGHALLLTVEGAIGPATLDYIDRGLERAADDGADLLILQLDTPGGLMESTRDIIQDVLNSPVPVATYVAPSGARAASAGTYMLLASHVAAMAPATHLGSATPVQMGGAPGAPEPETPEEDNDESNGENTEAEDGQGGSQGSSAMERKVLEDAVAYIRELADRHGRNADWAERAVREAVNLGAADAVEQNVADFIARDLDELLDQADGRTVAMGSGERTLATANLTVERFDPDWRTRLLSVITNPNIAYFLMLIGFYGLLFELSNPGNLFPGVIGAICLILALFAFQVLSVNYAGLALILLGLAFIVAEAFMPSFGVLGIGGLVAFVSGSIILMDGTHQAVSLPLIGGTATVAGGFLLWAFSRFLALRRRPVATGVEQMTGETARVLDDFEWREGRYRGHVQLSGERWIAVGDEPLASGQAVVVERIDGLTVEVRAEPS